ncbi:MULTISPECIES: hypothetical protein [Bradyrhizobium]|uniref:Uncharacterized protein n=1 Tax=Bradyrhizobium elkanii TaxID=29448 RepID=A0A4U6S4B4_BRAEL|nr:MULTISPECIES: hypothetical protein [Bradyrhizobium]MTV12302.1 hypothetical protein [Bradyrhizobium sp. BR2003]TKV79516.1 hypothetical protein FDV58_20260 [Bradyrhizobium elkanii]
MANVQKSARNNGSFIEGGRAQTPLRQALRAPAFLHSNNPESNPFLMLSLGEARMFKDTPKRVGQVADGRTNVS